MKDKTMVIYHNNDEISGSSFNLASEYKQIELIQLRKSV